MAGAREELCVGLRQAGISADAVPGGLESGDAVAEEVASGCAALAAEAQAMKAWAEAILAQQAAEDEETCAARLGTEGAQSAALQASAATDDLLARLARLLPSER